MSRLPSGFIDFRLFLFSAPLVDGDAQKVKIKVTNQFWMHKIEMNSNAAAHSPYCSAFHGANDAVTCVVIMLVCASKYRIVRDCDRNRNRTKIKQFFLIRIHLRCSLLRSNENVRQLKCNVQPATSNVNKNRQPNRSEWRERDRRRKKRSSNTIVAATAMSAIKVAHHMKSEQQTAAAEKSIAYVDGYHCTRQGIGVVFDIRLNRRDAIYTISISMLRLSC